MRFLCEGGARNGTWGLVHASQTLRLTIKAQAKTFPRVIRKHRSGFHTMSHFQCATLREGEGVGCLHEDGEPAVRCDFSLLKEGRSLCPVRMETILPLATNYCRAKGPRKQIFPY